MLLKFYDDVIFAIRYFSQTRLLYDYPPRPHKEGHERSRAPLQSDEKLQIRNPHQNVHGHGHRKVNRKLGTLLSEYFT